MVDIDDPMNGTTSDEETVNFLLEAPLSNKVDEQTLQNEDEVANQIKRCNLNMCLKELSRLFFDGITSDDSSDVNYDMMPQISNCKSTRLDSFSNIIFKTKSLKKKQIRIVDIFKLILNFTTNVGLGCEQNDARKFFSDLLSCASDLDTNLPNFIIKYYKSFKTEQFQQLLLIVQGINGTLDVEYKNSVTVGFAKSLCGKIVFKRNFEHFYNTYLKQDRCCMRTLSFSKKRELHEKIILQLAEALEKQTCVEFYIQNISKCGYNQEVLNDNKTLHLTHIINEVFVKNIFYLELASGVKAGFRGIYADISCTETGLVT